MPSLERHRVEGVTLLTDTCVGGGVTFAFTERTGGVSRPPFASLNLGSACGDDAACVAENRRRVLAALGAEPLLGSLVNPKQVHGDHVVVVRSSGAGDVAAAQAEAALGADAVVCTAPDVPVLLCFADCVPVVLVAPGGFAVIHSGWRGTVARIAAKAARVLCEEASCAPDELVAYVGPHVLARDYEVSEELAERFSAEFGAGALFSPRHLDLSACLARTFEEAGIASERVAWCEDSTASSTERFFSYRAEKGSCGGHGAVALMRERGWGRPADSKPADSNKDEGEARL